MKEEKGADMLINIPDGAKTENRVAVITDVHGRYEEFARAVEAIERKAETRLILLGDLIDRGPDSKGCLRLARELEEGSDFTEVVILPGNHEEMMLKGADDEYHADLWLGNGGIVMLREFGWDMNAATMALPRQVIRRLGGELPLHVKDGQLLFVHAGIDPRYRAAGRHRDAFAAGEPLGQGPLWVRHEFLSMSGGHTGPDGEPVTVVHGHTSLRIPAPGKILAKIRAVADVHKRFGLDTTGTPYLALAEMEGDAARVRVIDAKGQTWDRPDG